MKIDDFPRISTLRIAIRTGQRIFAGNGEYEILYKGRGTQTVLVEVGANHPFSYGYVKMPLDGEFNNVLPVIFRMPIDWRHSKPRF